MRPHVLEFQAFGPFPDRQRVDFDELGAAGLVLLHGDTGAGKTSVLDALGFALYGEVPGERGARGLRSEHAPASLETEVRLEFTARGRRWRIRRSPRQQVAKQRGDGLTVRQPSALLEEQVAGGGWRAIATRLDEVGQTVRDVVGLSAPQFFQVVLLPQGRFATFLHASADGRQALLQQLFGTERFTDVERLLKERRSMLAEATGRAIRAIAAQVDAVATAGGGERPDDDGGAPPAQPEDAAQWAQGVLVGLTADLEAAEAAVEAAELADAARADELLDAQALASRQQRRAAALQLRAELTDRAGEVAQARAVLVAARAAAPMGATVDRLDARRRERAELAARLTADGARLRDVLGGDGTLPELDAVLALERQLRDAAAAATPALEAEAELDRLRAEADRVSASVAAAQLATELARAAVARADEAMTAAIAALAEAERLAERAPELAALADAAVARAAAGERLGPARAEADHARRAHDDARASALSAREEWLALATRRVEGMAAELARELADGRPCRVCGAVEHPRPAKPPDDVVTEQDERLARASAERADAAVEPLRRAAERAGAIVAGLTATLGCSDDATPDVAALVADRAAAVDAAAAAAAAAAAVAGLREAADERARKRAEAAARLADVEAEAVAAAAQLVAAQAAVTERSATVDAARAGERSVAHRIARLTAEADDVAALAATSRAERALADEVTALERELARGAAAAGFADVAALRNARCGEAEVVALDATLRRFDDELAGVEARLAEPDLQVALDPPADVASARAAAAAAKAALTAAVAERAAYEQRCVQARAAAARIAELDRELRPRLAELQQVQALAELASGGAGNRLRMSLTSFVLAARLEAVAARASVRLARMTSGRFSLVHSDEVVDGRQRSGLGLAVRDVWTGTQRPTSSLSGGETFMTALALALGLADVVCEEAGGRRIETLFVDEGFGTLDDDSLDRVVDVLDDLRDGGRLVGVVSHVAELRRRVPARLEVVRGRAGSTLRAWPAPVYD